MRPEALLTLLGFGALIVGTKLYVERQLESQPRQDNTIHPGDSKYIAQLEEELDRLRNDNAALRNLLSAEATTEIDPALIDFVEKDVGLSFRTPPPVFKRSEDMLHEAASQLWLGTFNEVGLEMRSYAYDVLGLLPPNQNFIGQVIAAETTGAIGTYDYISGELLLAPHFDPENTHHQAGLIRLLAISLLDQYYPLSNTLTDDQFYCHIGLQRGRASLLQDRFYAIQARRNGFIDPVDNTEAREIFAALSPLPKAITTFANTHAKAYLATFPSAEAQLSTLKSDRASTQAIMLKRPLSTPPFTPAEGETIQLSTQLGALTLDAYLQQLELPDNTIRDLVENLHSDTLSITTATPNSATTSWSLKFTNADAATNFYQHGQKISSTLPRPPQIHQDGPLVVLSISEALETN
ncbi:hypothetical protein [Rubritalea tangerina]|uniref:Transglycosylase SLT domain-containing protein n=1 Tax=Rubritalea tangerina TaxID=430798 RepID=A0ABW4ZER5_9BACT